MDSVRAYVTAASLPIMRLGHPLSSARTILGLNSDVDTPAIVGDTAGRWYLVAPGQSGDRATLTDVTSDILGLAAKTAGRDPGELGSVGAAFVGPPHQKPVTGLARYAGRRPAYTNEVRHTPLTPTIDGRILGEVRRYTGDSRSAGGRASWQPVDVTKSAYAAVAQVLREGIRAPRSVVLSGLVSVTGGQLTHGGGPVARDTPIPARPARAEALSSAPAAQARTSSR